MSNHSTPPFSGPRVLRLVSTSDVAEAREVFSRVYAAATIEPRRDAPFSCSLDASSFGAVRAVTAAWAGGGRAYLPAIGEHYALHLSAGGECTGVHAGEPFVVAPGRGAALLSPGRPSLHNATPGFQGRTLTIDRGALDAHLTTLTGVAPRGPILFDVALDIADGPGRTVHEVAQLFRAQLERPWASPMLLTALRDAVYTSFLAHTRHSLSGILGAPPSRVAPACVRKAEEYMAAHAAEPITLAEIVAVAGVPERSLRAAFVACRGVPPMEFLRQRRFDLAHRSLAEPSASTSVASVATALGFGHPGRFSVEYKRRFGASPSKTLSMGRAAMGLPEAAKRP